MCDLCDLRQWKVDFNNEEYLLAFLRRVKFIINNHKCYELPLKQTKKTIS